MIEINYIAILVSTVIAVVLGMGWFGPVFGATWATIIGAKTSMHLLFCKLCNRQLTITNRK